MAEQIGGRTKYKIQSTKKVLHVPRVIINDLIDSTLVDQNSMFNQKLSIIIHVGVTKEDLVKLNVTDEAAWDALTIHSKTTSSHKRYYTVLLNTTKMANQLKSLSTY